MHPPRRARARIDRGRPRSAGERGQDGSDGSRHGATIDRPRLLRSSARRVPVRTHDLTGLKSGDLHRSVLGADGTSSQVKHGTQRAGQTACGCRELLHASEQRLLRVDPQHHRPVGFQNSAIASDQRFQAARSYSLIRPPGTGPRRIRRCPKRRDGRFWTWWAQLQRSMGPPCVVVRHILGKHPGEGVARRRSACGR
jgi:hypothetical protein